MKPERTSGWSIARVGRLPWPLLWHNAGTPETDAHRAARVSLYRIYSLLTWWLPKRLGLDRCSECGERPCGTRLGQEWLCPVHSVTTTTANGHGGRADLKVLPGGRP